MMKYKLDLTDIYRYFIDFDGLSGVEVYSSLPWFEKGTSICKMQLENLSINMDEAVLRDQILSVNPKSIINISDDLVILARKALLTIENVCCYDLKVMHNERDYYYSSGLKFNIKDRYIDFGGFDTEHLDSNIYGSAIFQGHVWLELEEDSIVPLMIGNDDQLGGYEEMKKINEKKRLEVKMKNKSLDMSIFNHIESPIWDFDFYIKHFSDHGRYKEAILDYPPSQNN
jgi:hypothetical protein